jgi:hypothetical protein
VTIPVLPDVEDILINSATALRVSVLPTVEDEFASLTVALVAAALEYAVELRRDPRVDRHAADLDLALATLTDVPVLAEPGSPFERASRALVWSQQNPGPVGDHVRAVLHPVLIAQTEEETAAAAPILAALHAAMHKAH